jgi:hypothetical protein
MVISTRELYGIAGGDRWLLAQDYGTGRVFVRHEANAASGAKVTDIEVGDFLRTTHAPEQQELLRLIGSLIGGSGQGAATAASESPDEH